MPPCRWPSRGREGRSQGSWWGPPCRSAARPLPGGRAPCLAEWRDGGAARGCATATAMVKFEVENGGHESTSFEVALLSELARSRRSTISPILTHHPPGDPPARRELSSERVLPPPGMHRCRAPPAAAHAPTAWAASTRRGNGTGTHSCPRALATLLEVECDLWQKRSGGGVIDHCSPRLPCTVAGNHEKWPARALLGSQLVRRIDAMRTAYRLGCAYAHTPLAGPVSWAEDHFGMGRR